MDNRALRQRKEVKYTYNYEDLSDVVGSDVSEVAESKHARKQSFKNTSKKVCPGCGDLCTSAARACKNCDFIFSSSGLQDDDSCDDDDDDIRLVFTFQPEREANGRPRLDQVIGMRIIELAESVDEVTWKPYSERKYEYEYLCKYKNISYLHLEWMTGVEIDDLGPKSRSSLSRFLTKLDKGLEVFPDSEFDQDFISIDRILDEKVDDEEEVIVDADGNELDSNSGKSHRQVIRRHVSSSSSALLPLPRQVSATSTSEITHLEDSYDYDYKRFLTNSDFEHPNWVPMYRCRQLWKRIVLDPLSADFLHPVDKADLPDYYDTVHYPMDLITVQSKLN